MTVAIKVENLSKKYIISHENKAQGYKTLSESLMQGSKRIANKIIHPFSSSEIESQTQEEFWALKDINFEINQGDKVGIIGRNGAGKSTLLKVLSRITDPTSGKIHINGRIASLLEVGTGFHPELTGRENIYLNGAILGMSRKEIKLKFDDIVAFAEVDKFLDTPVKRYSSGMYVRLAFAVAAHLESEILVVDEVLAVGDAEFQKKCLGKMGDVSKAGRTVLFVSHNRTAIAALCSKAILIDKGGIAFQGKASSALEHYVAIDQIIDSKYRNGYIVNNQILVAQNNSEITLKYISLVNPCNKNQGAMTGDPLHISVFYESNKKWVSPAFVISIKDINGLEIVRLSTMPISGFEIDSLFKDGEVTLKIDSLPLVSGRYYMDIGFVRESVEWILKLEEIIIFNVSHKDVYGSGFLLDRSRGLIAINHSWGHCARTI